MVAGSLTLGLSELLAAVAPGTPSLIGAVGDAVVDWLPRPVVRFGIAVFGGADKAVLIGVILALCALAAAALGAVGVRSLRPAGIGFTAFGLVGAATALRDPQANVASLLTSTAFAVAAGVAALGGLRRLDRKSVV